MRAGAPVLEIMRRLGRGDLRDMTRNAEGVEVVGPSVGDKVMSTLGIGE